MRIRSWIRATLLLQTLLLPYAIFSESLISPGSEWSYFKGVASPSPTGIPWWQTNKPDSTWPTATAPFRYGDGQQGTLLDDMSNRYTSLYLHKAFEVSDPSLFTAVDLKINYDDGFIVWINQHRLVETNAPEEPSFESRATGSHESGEFEVFELSIPSSFLNSGHNVIAIQGFNISPESSDFHLDVGLDGIEIDTDPPTLESMTPPPGKVIWLDKIALQFSEPVKGINSETFRLNNQSPISITGRGDRWVLEFTPPGFGEAQLTLAPNHIITDYGRPANPLTGGNIKQQYHYHVVDDRPPLVIDTLPPPGSGLNRLERIRLFFDESVAGFDRSDILINGEKPDRVTGLANGPWLIEFGRIHEGPVSIEWAPEQDIHDMAAIPNAFAGATHWDYRVDPSLKRPRIVINELFTSNQGEWTDDDKESSDWIELRNMGNSTVNLSGWALSNQKGNRDQWTFPSITIAPDQYILIFASGKNRRNPQQPLHTNFKLSSAGEHLALYDAQFPRRKMDDFDGPFPRQPKGYSYGFSGSKKRVYMNKPSPGQNNHPPSHSSTLPTPEFSIPSTAFQSGFSLVISPPEADSHIRYTLDASRPTEKHGMIYNQPIPITESTVVRARAFASGTFPSEIVTRSYLKTESNKKGALPILSLVSDESNLWGQTGIMESNPRNTNKHGIAWERPVSAELLPPNENKKGFQIDAGLRIQGGMAIRERYRRNPGRTSGKYSFRLYFRGRYGDSQLDYRLFPTIPMSTFKQIVLRAGMNDSHNPFLVDELNRRLFNDMGQVSSQGSFARLFLNGEYQGYYNLTERIDKDFLKSRHRSDAAWDLIAQFGEVREGDMIEWNRLKRTITDNDLSDPAHYQQALTQLDIDNFIDYIMVCVYADMDDWPGNNWRAARERLPNAKWRFYIWDAERSFGSNGQRINGRRPRDFTSNNLTEGTLTQGSDIARIFQSISKNPQFRLRFADRVHKHYFNGGALTDENIKQRHSEMVQRLRSVIPRMDPYIEEEWIPRRRPIAMKLMAGAGLQRSENAPRFSQHGGSVPSDFRLSITATEGEIYVSLDGSDPSPTSGTPDSRLTYSGPIPITRPTKVKARTLVNGEWSALNEADFIPAPHMHPVRLSEIMYHPVGGEEYEYVELSNPTNFPASLRYLQIGGINFSFGIDDELASGERIVIASNKNPVAFSKRYPRTDVFAYFEGTLANNGETIQLKDSEGKIMSSLSYKDQSPWPKAADGRGTSLERVDLHRSAEDPVNWRASKRLAGSPGR